MIKISNWQRRFYKTILDRGKNYYRYGMVHDMETDENNTITARVGNEYFYDVSIQVNEDGSIRNMSCSCPFAQSGNNCKHEAALLYNYEKSLSLNNSTLIKKKPENTILEPFKEDFEKEEYFFDLHKLTKNYKFRKNMLEQAEKMVQNHLISLERVMLAYDSYENQQILQASAIYDGNYSQERVTIRLSADRIESLNCDNYSCKGYNSYGYYYYRSGDNLCVHKLALLLLVKDYILKRNPGDLTDEHGFLFLNEFTENRKEKTEEKQHDDSTRQDSAMSPMRL